MKPRSLPLFALSTLSLLLSLGSMNAQAIGRLADVTVVDRETGVTLPLHYANGEYWVAGRPGARYAVTVRNRTGERVLAVPSVDGVNVLSGETAAWDQRGYVFSPYERYQITGWRKSSSEIAAFEFSSASSSYAGLTGRPANVGVIGVALFREQQALPPPLPQVSPQWPRRGVSPRDEESSETREPAGSLREMPSASAAAPAPDAGAASPAQKAESAERNDASDNLAKSAPGQSAQRTPKLGTAHGQREASVVTQTTFTRQQAQPNETISIRYDSRENLIAAGVIRQPIRPLAPRAFPQSDVLSYVPDPPRY